MIYEAESRIGVAGKKAIEVLEKINYIRNKKTEFRRQNSEWKKGRTGDRVLRPNALIILKNFGYNLLFLFGF